jgi:hypothetical protein
MTRALLALVSLLFAFAACGEPRKYAVLSLIGDELMLAGAEQTTGGRLDRNPRKFLEISDPFADKAALLAVHEVVKQKEGTEPMLLFGKDRRLYQAQARMMAAGENMSGLLADIRPLLANTAATHLILITKYQGEARIKLDNDTIGHGQLRGIGYYYDPNVVLQVGEARKTAVGFVAAFAYFNAAVIRLDTGAVIADQRVTASSTYTTPSSVDAEDVWGGMPAAERVRLVRDLVGREVRAVTPKLLAESR